MIDAVALGLFLLSYPALDFSQRPVNQPRSPPLIQGRFIANGLGMKI
jgi:hypothetical protein